MNLRIPLIVNRTGVLGVLAVLLTALTYLDYTGGLNSSNSDGLGEQRKEAALPAVDKARSDDTLGGHHSTSRAWHEIRRLSLLQEHAPAVARRYQSLATPYAELMAEVAVLHGIDEKPDAAAKRAIGALLPPTVKIKTLLVTDGLVAQQHDTLLTVNLSLESSDSRAMQQAVTALGNPAAGLLWREFALSADSEKHLITLTGLLSVLAVRYAE